ncbi:hypothetical protein [Pseudonocardia acaciae]|uniref:hypothetical protein n=1 Tax=Pseudonocardia acaciae TaxID=551276 RepID=UPI00048C9984|nr:hypothetical protein [Pseudonocardia acaciae]
MGNSVQSFGRAVLLPAAVFQIVEVGPGFSTGREVAQYAGQFGAVGVWTLPVIFVGFAVLCALGYELARVLRTYNYREYIRELVGPLWPLFDVLWIVLTILVTGIVTSGVGEVLSRAFGVPYLVAVLGVFVLIGLVLFFGRGLFERFDVLGSLLFSGGISAFAIFVLVQRWDAVESLFTRGDTSLAASPSLGAALLSGLVYVGYNISALIPVLFCLDRQTRRSEAVFSGVLSSVLVVVPFALTYLALASFYEKSVVEAPIPWLVMFERSGGSVFAGLFAVVFVYAVVDTSASNIHAFIQRVNSSLEEGGRKALTMPRRGACSAVILAASFFLSQLGIIALVDKGYTYFAYAFLLIFVVPLLTRGVYLINARSKVTTTTMTTT